MSNSLPYIGSKISLISNNEIRYEGILYTINTEESTIALQNVKSFGSEDRKATVVPGSEEVYDFIIFRGKDIKDLSVLDGGKPQSPALQDPAIVSVNKVPVISTGTGTSKEGAYGKGKGWRSAESWEKPRRNDDGQGYGKGKGGKFSYGGGKGKFKYGKGGKGGKGKGKLYRKELSTPVGELSANVNESTKNLMKNEFDFTSALEKFDKPGNLGPEAKTGDGSNIEAVLEGYSKSRSFFDAISCDATDRKHAKEVNVKELKEKFRALDKETFGEDALKRPFPNSRKGKGKGFRRNW